MSTAKVEQVIEHNNASFAYDYTQKTLEKVNKNLDEQTAKLSGALAFSGVILKFAETLSDNNWLVWVKVAICCFAAFSIASCGVGLSPVTAGEVVDPASFLDPTIYRLSDEECKIFTMRHALQGIAELDNLIERRRKHLNVAITFIVLSGIGIAFSISASSLGL